VGRTRTTPAEQELKDLLAATGIDIAAMEPVMNTEQVADLLEMTVPALEQARYRGMGIPYVKVGNRVRYLRVDVARYLVANRRQPVVGA
jgi:hypothetical protein